MSSGTLWPLFCVSETTSRKSVTNLKSVLEDKWVIFFPPVFNRPDMNVVKVSCLEMIVLDFVTGLMKCQPNINIYIW